MADPGSWDLLDENCSDISDWIDSDGVNGVSEVSPAGQFRMDCNTHAASNKAIRYRDIGSFPNEFTVEIKIYHDALGITANVDRFFVVCRQSDEIFQNTFASDGLFIYDTGSGATEVGTNLVLEGGSAEWQTWRFLITFTGVTGDGTCDVYLKNTSTPPIGWLRVGTAIPCSSVGTHTDGRTDIGQLGYNTDDMLTHIDYYKIATGLYAPNVYYFSGHIFEQDNPVSRKLYLYDRLTGDLVTTTTSSGDGYYYMETASSGSHNIVCLDDEAGVDYNDLIKGNVSPTMVSG